MNQRTGGPRRNPGIVRAILGLVVLLGALWGYGESERLTLISVLDGRGVSWAKPLPQGQDRGEDELSPLSPDECRLYSMVVYQTAVLISSDYYREVSVPQLLAAALSALADEVGERVPPALRNDPEKWFDNTEPVGVIMEFRKQLGNRRALRGRDLEISLRGMFKILDPHTGFLTAQDRKRMYQMDTAASGTGLVLAERMGKGPVVIADVDLGSPAHWAGLVPGDRIWAIDGQSIEELPSVEVEARLQALAAQIGRRIHLSVETAQTATRRQVELTSEIYEVESVLGFRRTDAKQWSYWLDESAKIGYVRILEIYLRTPDKFQSVLRELTNQGLRGLVLDLRDCTGGSLNAALRIADLLLAEGPICTVKYRRAVNKGLAQPGGLQETHVSSREDSFTDFPLMVLIGSETRGGGELIAAALQDNQRAILVGQRTHGKATVQQPIPLTHPVGPYHEMKLSVGLFQRPSGKNMQRPWNERESDQWGVLPDRGFEVRLSPQLEQRLREGRRQRDLSRPEAAHALDNPKADPVLYWALRALRKQLEKRS
ncbi:MAG: S41 family peptidase [Gemmatales bacterium]|nr:S41 family peptidase [Gemmatales bacterium]MCS7159293.1 S41 family peptidase [Gemmatales bacterium]MDW8174493.1 S41 family peptidase [Gemmatales bacterium]MDW8224075.1 S41 family peptidase [Gemmatales bacterium]